MKTGELMVNLSTVTLDSKSFKIDGSIKLSDYRNGSLYQVFKD